MKAFFALVAREVSERRALLAAAAVASLLPLLAPLLPSTGTNPPEDIREAVMWVVLGGLAPPFALLLGVGFIGRDLSEGRMGFYYAQPISGPMIWFARITGVLVLLWLVELVIMLPTVVLSPDPVQFFYLANVLDPFVPKWVVPTLMWAVSLAILLLAHAVGVIWRARSLWLVLDFLALLVVVGVGWLSLRPFLVTAWDVFSIGIAWLAICLLTGLIVAGAVQVSTGRVDLRRSHGAMSTTLWGIVAGAVVVLAGWSHWILSAEPSDIDELADISVGGGEWIGIAGTSPLRFDYHPQFLFNVSDGRWLRIGGVRTWYGSFVRFSSDSTRVFWLVNDSDHDLRLWYADLTGTEVIPSRTEIVTENHYNAFRVSSDGARAAFIDGQTVTVYDVDDERLVMAAKIEEPFDPDRTRFTSRDELSVFASTPWRRTSEERRHRIYSLDLRGRTIDDGRDVESDRSWWDEHWTFRADRKLEAIKQGDRYRLVIVDPRAGKQIADIGTAKYWAAAEFVSNERIILLVDDDDQRLLRVFDYDGNLVNEFPVGRCERVYTGGEPRSGLLMIGHHNFFRGSGKHGVDSLASVVDLDSGEAVRIFIDQTPVLGTWGTWSSAGAWKPGSTATRLLHGKDGALLLWDPDTDELEQLIPVPN